ncbi:MAG TPA: hypothetical protein VLS96_19310 [Nodosilinea sp.]|nr:hypothetical protein [Nodosilinea sp.]
MTQMLKPWALAVAAVGVLAVGPALAEGPVPLAAESAPATVPDAAPEAAPAAGETTSYTYADLFSIAFPAGWRVSEQADAPQVVGASAGNAADLPAVRTEVTWHDAPPRTVVADALAAIQASGYTVARYDAATIDGVTAIRLWLSDLPEELPNAYITYIGYPAHTATVASYYGEATGSIDPLLDAIHGSFQRSR